MNATTTTLGLSLPVLAHTKSSGTLDSPANLAASSEEALMKYYAQMPASSLQRGNFLSLTMT